jgi:hypothetical protein
LKVWLNLPVFFDERYLNDNTDAYSITSLGNRAAHSWLHMVCPSQQRYIDFKTKQFGDLIKRIRPDYISYDFLRFYVFWEKVELGLPPETIEHGCYCPECQRRYRKFSGERLSIANGIVERSQRNSLGEWKKTVITETTRKLNGVVAEAARGTPVYIKTIPWKTTDLDHGMGWISGQDIESLGGMSEGIIPMAFTQILGQTPNWKKELLDHVTATTGKEVMSYIQFEPLIRQTTITNEQLGAEIQTAIDEKRAGLIYFHYEQILSNPEKRQIVGKYGAC